jgi:hypothetical protein
MSRFLHQAVSSLTMIGYLLIITGGPLWHDHRHCCSHPIRNARTAIVRLPRQKSIGNAARTIIITRIAARNRGTGRFPNRRPRPAKRHCTMRTARSAGFWPMPRLQRHRSTWWMRPCRCRASFCQPLRWRNGLCLLFTTPAAHRWFECRNRSKRAVLVRAGREGMLRKDANLSSAGHHPKGGPP